MSRKREEERLERIIRDLLRLPENRRCINCNHLGPQYVCTTFLTFVCTTCSGVHREFNHRVKSVSMAKFKSEEVTALQAAGNERARQIYLKTWDPERNTHPDGSNIHKIRDFIRHVYVDRRYTGQRSFSMHAMAKSGQKGSFNERHLIERSGLGSREDFYERRYHERESPSGRSDRNYRDYINDSSNRNYIDGKDYKNCIEDRSPDSIYERYGTLRSRSAAHFEIVDNRNQNDRYGRRSQSFRTSRSDTSMSPEPHRIREEADNMAPETQSITGKAKLPVLRPLKDIMGKSPPTLKVSDPSKAIKAKDSNAAANDQKKSFSGSHGSADVKADDNKSANASGLIQYDNNSELPDTSTKAQTEFNSSVQSSIVQRTNNPPSINSVEFLLFELSGLAVGNASEKSSSNAATLAAPATLSTSPVASSTEPVVSSIVPTASVLPAGNATKISSSNTASSTAPGTLSTSPVALSTEPLASSIVPTASSTPGDASAEQSTQAVSKAAQATTSPRNESKSTGRKELPAELFTFSYPTYSAPADNWQFRPPYGVGHGMQYAPSPRVTAFPGTAKSWNPFDLGDDSRAVQGAMLSSIEYFPGAVPQTSPHSGLQPQPSPIQSGHTPELPSYRMNMSAGGYIGQLPNNMPIPRPRGIGNFGGNDDGNTALATLNPYQHSTGGYSSNLIPTASNSFSSTGGNPFA
ncbi:hypothetical protein DCAR_0207060 [Daucus carota subsp. sativus]|uniref:Arf-GAP domain-containing protein n=1 Tax=Daucus carota subsp. sativus TaxID=79200 RepID=A0AAF0WGB8_DAUCS|nr:hypothetical protein DCAR_0207060 [Daucus carota subsp. sativus]